MSLDSRNGFQIEPKKFRLFFVVLYVLLMILIWSVSLIGLQVVRENLVISLKERIESDTLVLEDHASRSLDTVTARLESLIPITNEDALRVQALSTEFLRQIVFEDRIIRSLSLIDPSGKVVASSTADNLGVTLPKDFLPGPVSHGGMNTVQYGRVYPFRDLYQVGTTNPSNESNRFWVTSLVVKVGQADYQ